MDYYPSDLDPIIDVLHEISAKLTDIYELNLELMREKDEQREMDSESY